MERPRFAQLPHSNDRQKVKLTVFAAGIALPLLCGCDDATPMGNGSLTIEGGYQCTYLHSGGSVDFVYISTTPLDWKKSGQCEMGIYDGHPVWTKGYQCENGASRLWHVGDGTAEVAGQKFDLSDGELFIMESDFSVIQVDAQFEDLEKDRLAEEVAGLYKTHRGKSGPDQPAPESKREGNEKPNPEADGRSR